MNKDEQWHIDVVIEHLAKIKEQEQSESESEKESLTESEKELLKRCEFAKRILGEGGDLFLIDVGGSDE